MRAEQRADETLVEGQQQQQAARGDRRAAAWLLLG